MEQYRWHIIDRVIQTANVMLMPSLITSDSINDEIFSQYYGTRFYDLAPMEQYRWSYIDSNAMLILSLLTSDGTIPTEQYQLSYTDR